uniref:C2 NT-type domain-containing protein n=1 Tax=Romanomermis culicivorax TaxID=13658 RepID=A0A915ITT9_ROMCU
MPEGCKFINPYVRLTMIQKGRTMEKHITTVHFNVTGNDLSFNEQFFFDLPNDEVNKVALLCSIFHKRSISPQNSADYGIRTTALSTGAIAAAADANNNLDVFSLGNSSGGSGGSRERASMRRSRSISSEPSHEDSSSLSLPRTRTSARQSSNSRSICLGMIAFGSFSKSSGKMHWTDVINNPRKQITQMHKLQQ